MRQLAIISDYQGLIAVLRERAEQLDVSNETLDGVTGLASGYTGKIMGRKGHKPLGRLSLGLMLQALGLKLAVLEDPEQLARMRPRLTKRRGGSRRGQVVREPAVVDPHP
jgi:hypothetical protein